MSDRREKIILLLRTRDDGLPEQLRSTSYAASGFVHDTLAMTVCPVCEGVDSFACTGCGGRGEVSVRRTRDPYATDVVLPYGFTGDPREQQRERDRQIDRLAEQTAAPRSEADLLAEANANPYVWERERASMYRRYDYAALDRALDDLRARNDAAYHALHAVHVYGWLAELSPAAELAVEAGLAFLDERLPDPLRVPDADHPAEARQARRRAA